MCILQCLWMQTSQQCCLFFLVLVCLGVLQKKVFVGKREGRLCIEQISSVSAKTSHTCQNRCNSDCQIAVFAKRMITIVDHGLPNGTTTDQQVSARSSCMGAVMIREMCSTHQLSARDCAHKPGLAPSTVLSHTTHQDMGTGSGLFRVRILTCHLCLQGLILFRIHSLT